MGILAIMYLIMGLLIFFGVLGVLVIIAGKDIIMAFERRFMPRGCDVFVANTNRNISHYYKKPEENQFKIDNLPYVTNPEKTMNLSDFQRKMVVDSLLRRQERIQRRINDLIAKKQPLLKMLKASNNEQEVLAIKAEVERIDGIMQTFEKKLLSRLENYFKDKRPAFFYIEGDPVPKDFYEFYSALDCRIVDNLISRAISRPPDAKDIRDYTMMKYACYAAAAGSAIAIFLAFRLQTMLGGICTQLGAQCGM